MSVEILKPEMDAARLLRRRAELLARVPAGTGDAGVSITALAFALGTERYALETCYVKEVQLLKELVWLPSLPAFVLGVINLRGRIYSVLDLKKFFGLPAGGLGEMNKVIIAGDGKMELAIAVDGIEGLTDIPAAGLQPPLATLKGVQRDYVRGLTSGNLILLDAAKMLSDGKIVVE